MNSKRQVKSVARETVLAFALAACGGSVSAPPASPVDDVDASIVDAAPDAVADGNDAGNDAELDASDASSRPCEQHIQCPPGLVFNKAVCTCVPTDASDQ